jgi:hypothetical protein
VPWYATLDWQRGGNALTQIVRLSERAGDLDLPASIITTKGIETGYTFNPKLAHAQEYFWRVDTVDAEGRVTPGPVWNFRTEPLTVSFSNFTVSHSVWPASRRVTISVRVHCISEQRIVVGASFAGNLNDPNRETAITTMNDPNGVLYTREFELPPGANPWGNHHFTLAAWLDWNRDGKVTKTDQQVSLYSSGRVVCGLWEMRHAPVRLVDSTPPLITGFTATPAVLNAEAMVPLALSARITDGNGTGVQLVRAAYRRNGGAQTLLPLLTWNVTGDLWQTTVNMPALTGDYQVSLHAMDAHESFGTASTNLRIADQSPPRLTVTAPLNGRAVPTGGSIHGNAEDLSALASIEYRLDGGAWASLPVSNSWTISAPAVDGPHKLEMRATDAAGNVSPVLTHYFYVPGDPANPDTFDEVLPLDNGHVPQHWSAEFQSAPFAGLNNQRLEASEAPHTASLYRQKTVPSWVDAVELSFRLTGYGGVQWSDLAGRHWRMTAVPVAANAQLMAGPVTNSASLNFTPGSNSMTCRLLISNGRMECRLIRPAEPPLTLDITDPTLHLNTLTQLRWQAHGHSSVLSALDDLQIRGLRPENRFRILSTVPAVNGWRITCTAAPGRNYRLLGAPDPAGPWLSSFPLLAEGLLLEFMDPVTPPQPERRFWRVEELP